MTHEAQRIAIAKACGVGQKWLLIKRGFYYRPNAAGYCEDIASAGRFDEAYAKSDVSATNGDVRMVKEPLPDYLNDLNAMHEAEKMLQGSGPLWQMYGSQIQNVVNYHCVGVVGDYPRDLRSLAFLVHATAAQRAEAFVRTIGKFIE